MVVVVAEESVVVVAEELVDEDDEVASATGVLRTRIVARIVMVRARKQRIL